MSRFLNYKAVSPLRDATVLDFHEHGTNERARHGREGVVFIKSHGSPESLELLLRKGCVPLAFTKLLLSHLPRSARDKHNDTVTANYSSRARY